MGYYTLILGLATSEMCTIIFPWGKYSYQRLTMGASNAPDVFQAKMGTLFQDLEYERAYILDDLLILSSSTFEDHLDKTRAGTSAFARKRLAYQRAKFNIRY